MNPDLNTLGLIILVSTLLLWKLDFIATLLNIKNTRLPIPHEFSELCDQERHETSQQYLQESARFSMISSTYSLTVFLAFWLFGGFAWLDELSRSLFSSPLGAGLSLMTALYLGSSVLSMPFQWYETFVLEEKFGFNKTSLKTYVLDQLKGFVLFLVLGLPLLALLLWVFEQDIPFVWLWAWLVFSSISLLLSYLAPSYILPIFNKFQPMEEGSLRSKIEAMAEHCEFPLTEIHVMDGSKRSSKANAFFTGFGSRKKIALYDTLIEGQSEEGIVAILAHEIGHYKKKHVVKMMACSLFQTGLIFYLLGLAIQKEGAFAQMLFEAFGLGAEQISVAGGIVFFLFLFKPVSRLFALFMNHVSRKHEFEADAYAVNAQGTAKYLIEGLKKLGVDQLSHLTPHPLRVFLDYSHPPLLQRIEALRLEESKLG